MKEKQGNKALWVMFIGIFIIAIGSIGFLTYRSSLNGEVNTGNVQPEPTDELDQSISAFDGSRLFSIANGTTLDVFTVAANTSDEINLLDALEETDGVDSFRMLSLNEDNKTLVLVGLNGGNPMNVYLYDTEDKVTLFSFEAQKDITDGVFEEKIPNVFYEQEYLLVFENIRTAREYPGLTAEDIVEVTQSSTPSTYTSISPVVYNLQGEEVVRGTAITGVWDEITIEDLGTVEGQLQFTIGTKRYDIVKTVQNTEEAGQQPPFSISLEGAKEFTYRINVDQQWQTDFQEKVLPLN